MKGKLSLKLLTCILLATASVSVCCVYSMDDASLGIQTSANDVNYKQYNYELSSVPESQRQDALNLAIKVQEKINQSGLPYKLSEMTRFVGDFYELLKPNQTPNVFNDIEKLIDFCIDTLNIENYSECLKLGSVMSIVQNMSDSCYPDKLEKTQSSPAECQNLVKTEIIKCIRQEDSIQLLSHRLRITLATEYKFYDPFNWIVSPICKAFKTAYLFNKNEDLSNRVDVVNHLLDHVRSIINDERIQRKTNNKGVYDLITDFAQNGIKNYQWK